MKITLSLQPGNKVQIPLEIPDEELKALTVLNLKEKIMELNKQKKLEELHVVFGSTILDDDKIIHSSGKVRIDSLKNDGIYTEKGINSHHLNSIKRFI